MDVNSLGASAIRGGDSDAAEKVLNIPELLEQILFELPFKDLLLVQRVSKDFRNVIVGSTKLLQLLHLEPAAADRTPMTIPVCPRAMHITTYLSFEPLFESDNIDRLYLTMWVDGPGPGMKDGISHLPEYHSWRRMYLTQPPICEVTGASMLRFYPEAVQSRSERHVFGGFVVEERLTLGLMADRTLAEKRRLGEKFTHTNFNFSLESTNIEH